MKRFVRSPLLLVLGLWSVNGLSQTNYWAQSAGGITTDEAMGVSVDASGNTYTVGYFSALSTFGPYTLNSSGVTDVFITKLDTDGYFQWAIKAGGTGPDRALAIETDDAGNSYITGYFQGTANFGSQTLTSAGAQDVFVAKYDTDGQLIWVTSAGGANADIANAVDFDSNGNVVITGEFSGTATFGSETLTSQGGSIDVFTAKLNASGEFDWAKKGSAHATDRGIDVAFDPSGNVIVTGQFTDTITFDNTHINNTYNSIFIVKYSSSGVEQWFRMIGAGSMNVINGIAIDQSGNAFVTGDFEGEVIFFGTPNTTLNHPYSNRIFLAKYSPSGALLRTQADGSYSEVTARNLALDNNGDPFIVGNFQCRLESYSEQYGEGTFNSVGFWDVFLAKYSSAGNWQWARSMGGRDDDTGNGITVDGSGEPIIVGAFTEQLFVPEPDNFIEHDATMVTTGTGYCSDNEYRKVQGLNATGGLDAFMVKAFDSEREPFDYYRRTGTGCDRSFVGVCIGGVTCPDTITYCGSGFVSANNNVSSAGPQFTYQWSNNSPAVGISVTQTDWYSVTQTTLDGCFESSDSIYVHINTFPPQPFISDDLGINIEGSDPEDILLCAPDSVLLTGSGHGGYEPNWNGAIASQSESVWATHSGTYSFYYEDENGCFSANTVDVDIDSLFVPIVPEMICIDDPDGNDSITFCEGESFTMFVFDSISNPIGNQACIDDAVIAWSASPSTINYSSQTDCPTSNNFMPQVSGDYLIEATVIRINHCDTDQVVVSRSIHVELDPVPNLGPVTVDIIGDTHLCPGDSLLLVATEAINHLWTGPGVAGTTNDSVWVFQPGSYSVSTNAADTNEYGCIASVSDVASIQIEAQTQPVISMQPSNGVICPNDSVLIVCTGAGSFDWQGPSGSIGVNQASIWVNTSGTYYCIRTDQYGCEMVSNSVEVDQYATPFIITTGQPILCPGESMTLSAVTNPGSSLEWLPPLSGNETEQTISEAGTYTCLVSSCGVQTEASVTVVVSDVSASVSVIGPSTVCEGDTVFMEANAGQGSYEWSPGGETETEIAVFESGNYSVSTFDANGCTAQSQTVNVTIVENTVQAPFVPDTAVCPGGYAIFNTQVQGSVFWYDDAETEDPIAQGPSFTTPELDVSTVYFVQQKSAYCPSEKAPVYVDMDDCEGIETSTVFSPNGDGINDVFRFPEKGGTYFRCRIYNRWGRLIYRWDDKNEGWDGTIQLTGAKVNDGVYYYILDYRDYEEKPIEETGFLHVVGSR